MTCDLNMSDAKYTACLEAVQASEFNDGVFFIVMIIVMGFVIVKL